VHPGSGQAGNRPVGPACAARAGRFRENRRNRSEARHRCAGLAVLYNSFIIAYHTVVAMSPRETILASLRSFWTRGRHIERIGYLVGLLLLTSGIVHLGILSLGGGSWDGPLSFRKPAVFGLSFGLTLITIVWTASFLPLAERT